MKPKLFLTVLALVVIPTALLSFMASRALRNREIVLEGQLKTRGSDAINTVSTMLSNRLNDEMEHVRAVLGDCLSRGGRYHDMASASTRLTTSRKLVKDAYLFLNPWGLMYPQASTVEDTPTHIRPGWDFIPGEVWAEEGDELVAVLRKGITGGGSKAGKLRFRVEDRAYCFAKLDRRSSLFAGYEIDDGEFNRIFTEAVSEYSGEEFVLVYSLPEGNERVTVTDSFGQVSEINEEKKKTTGKEKGETGRGSALAVGCLEEPFSQVAVSAYARDPEGMARAGRFQARMLMWSIVLMAGGICAGMWLVLKEGSAEIRRARARTDFVIGVSHDLRTPVASMKMLAESLCLGHVPDKDKQNKFLGTIAKECDRLADMIERVLFFMKEEHGASIYKFKRIEIGSVVAENARAFSDRRHGAVDVEVDVAKDVPDVDVDDDAIAKVLFNLMDNAVKYSAAVVAPHPDPLPEGEGVDAGVLSPGERMGGEGNKSSQVDVKVRVDSVERRGKRWVRIAVKDFGIGIESRELKQVFKKFYRASLESEGKVGGIGLGLALCRSIIESHNGRIEAESTPGEGSTFTILLPVGK